ncbi:muscarinic acetylcholine receptor DM1 isoform X1 [Anopheles merus]|uniref:muscarinic acetylcholine receptor DM1 isoform X1 n=1 Tax=Anopheles merus TaxID=30066 RepID=UPI001BE4926F|nr:muscarinic acetylcholine receptor DM1 isoform X1 [Anopheles merus]XP_041781897.1 muscarinic acetylcholine receptor DM1 isoform X1 [Anopheles merus]XP_041781898.1 muscarinic acetylcholine receptor DM1 isoform X1 [Anopheles merus]XP_041781899.1 muscarinic acetylcholine receptor DM1 isoform X1 [Anopheles merus]XP_041781900.1 muscarinic acetylcholine receptor DM1 isoform X1 [Anopheles merus]XP_041781901.1 muscarinic acetylcholine receptor DM1 isoform X1 [Anopheles merus]
MGGFPFERTTVDSFLSRYTTETSIPTATTTVTAVEELFFNVTSSSDSLPTANGTLEVLVEDPPTYSLAQIIILGIIATVLSILTVAGNVMVMISFKIDKQLQTISNYFLFSLAIADFAIGLISMPLFSVTTLLGYWPLGPHICDTWLALDYLASNASVLNLLIISFDRYFSVTRPLTYRAKRTTTRAAIMIGAAWGISLLLWPPWIYSWPYIEGKRTVPEKECYIQFIETNHYITFGTAIAAFYVPVTVMCFLYYRIWRETKKRQKELKNLTGDRKKDSSKRSNSSDENTAVNHSGGHVLPASVAEDGWRRPRSESSADAESVYMTNAVLPDGAYGHGMLSRRSSITMNGVPKKPTTFFGGIKEWCIAWWHSGREDSDDYGYDVEEPSDLGYATPVSIETPLPSSVTRCTSLNVIRDPYVAGSGGRSNVVSMIPDISPTPIRPALPPLAHLQDMHGARDSRSLPNSNRLGSRSVSQDSVYTILIRLPPEGGSGDERAPSIKMIQDDVPMSMTVPPRRPLPSRDSDYIIPVATRRQSTATTDFRLPLSAKIISKPLSKQQQQLHQANLAQTARQVKKKKKSQEKRQETKAAKTLSAILLSFIITWTPYNILVLLKPLTACTKCIPQELWDFFYALCYINSTINPVCYALCNASFRRTYVRILTCKWHTRNREAMTRGVYN